MITFLLAAILFTLIVGAAAVRRGIGLAVIIILVLWAYGHDLAQREKPADSPSPAAPEIVPTPQPASHVSPPPVAPVVQPPPVIEPPALPQHVPDLPQQPSRPRPPYIQQ